jgi:hypothetical protein
VRDHVHKVQRLDARRKRREIMRILGSIAFTSRLRIGMGESRITDGNYIAAAARAVEVERRGGFCG